MLVSMNAMRIYEMASHYAKTEDKFVVVIDNTRYGKLTTAKQQTVRLYYDNILPEDEVGEIFDNPFTFYAFSGQAVATEWVTDHFPQSTDLDDEDYFIEVQVITPNGGIPYTNKVLTN